MNFTEPFFLIKPDGDCPKPMLCERCGKVVFRGDVDMSTHTIVPLGVVQVAEAACREAGYNDTARKLRRSLTAEK